MMQLTPDELKRFQSHINSVKNRTKVRNKIDKKVYVGINPNQEKPKADYYTCPTCLKKVINNSAGNLHIVACGQRAERIEKNNKK